MNLRDKIQALYTSTTSTEVKAICESYLGSKDNTKNAELSLFESLSGVRSADSNVNTLLTEQENLQQSINGIESKISKNAAQKLMESWGGVGSNKASNVGNHVNNVIIRENSKEVANEKLIMEGLRAISDTDSSANDILKSLEAGSYGVSESINTLKNSSIAKHPQFKYILEKFEGYINRNVSESKVVKNYIDNLSAYTWDKEVSESYNKIKSVLESKSVEVEVQNAIFDIKNTDSKGFFSSIVEKLNNWLNNDKRNVPTLLKEMKAFQFNTIVRDLSNKLLLIENTKGTQFNVPVNGSNCEISSLYSPAINKSGVQIFRAGSNFYAANKDGVHKMSEAQVNALPNEFLSLCEAFFNPAVKVANDNIIVYVGKNKVTIGDSIKVNEQTVSLDTLGSTLMTYSQGTIFANANPLIKVAVTLAENAANIVEIDFGKAIFSNLYEGVGVYMFRRSDKIFMNKVNPTMNENKFFEANGIQAVKFVKNFLSYNIAESLSDLLSGDVKKKVDMEQTLNSVMNNITLLESELNKIESAIANNPEIADVQEVVTAKELVSGELNNARAAWQEINTELKKFENADEENEEEPIEITDEEPTEEEPAVTEDPTKDPDADNDDEGGLPIVNEPTNTDVPPTNGAVLDTPAADDMVNVGLAGAEGAQTQTQVIQGNDHQDAGATQATEIGDETGGVVASGFAGAEGTQQVDTGEQNLADATAVPVTTASAEITIPDNIAPNAQDSLPTEVTEPPVNIQEEPKTEPVVEEPTSDAADAAAGKVIVPEAPEQGEEKSNEALDTNVQVKLKGSDKIGKITASNSTEHTFTVLWDNGETGDYNEDALEEIKPESADNQADNADAAAKSAEKVAEGEQTPEGSAEEPENPEVFIKATITIDFGPYKEGEQIEINAADFTAAGDDDPVHVKSPKEEIGTLPKKYVKIADEQPEQEMGEVESKMESVIKNLEEIGTFVKENDKIDSKSIEEALEKLKAYRNALSKK